MKARSKKTVQIQLILNEEEANLLIDMIQNTRHEDLQSEPPAEKKFRYELFTTLKNQLEK